MANILDEIRQRYRKYGMDGVWRYCHSPDNPCVRAKRFDRAAVWARRKKHEAGTKDKDKWRHAQEVYHNKAVYYGEKCERRRRRKRDGGGSGTCTPVAGPPNWACAEVILVREVVPTYVRLGSGTTSAKRTSTLSNPSSDHYVGNRTASARDNGAFGAKGAQIAHAIANSLGIGGYRTGTYTSYYITRFGRRYRVQILWAVSGHFDHDHTGIRLIGSSGIVRLAKVLPTYIPGLRGLLYREDSPRKAKKRAKAQRNAAVVAAQAPEEKFEQVYTEELEKAGLDPEAATGDSSCATAADLEDVEEWIADEPDETFGEPYEDNPIEEIEEERI